MRMKIIKNCIRKQELKKLKTLLNFGEFCVGFWVGVGQSQN